LSIAAVAQIQAEEVLVSPAVVLELQFLHEIKRSKATALKVIERMSAEIGLAICRLPFAAIVEHALDQAWTRDPLIGSSSPRPVPTMPRSSRRTNEFIATTSGRFGRGAHGGNQEDR
jgi:hypothetical protein